MSKHGMQMGGSGYGMTHGYGDGDDVDRNNSHEYGSGHGVSMKWVTDRVKSGQKGASNERMGKFHDRMGKIAAKADSARRHPKSAGSVGGVGHKAASASFMAKGPGYRFEQAYNKKSRGHGMDDHSSDNSHEYGHGVSGHWIRKRVSSGIMNGKGGAEGEARVDKFAKKMKAGAARSRAKGNTGMAAKYTKGQVTAEW